MGRDDYLRPRKGNEGVPLLVFGIYFGEGLCFCIFCFLLAFPLCFRVIFDVSIIGWLGDSVILWMLVDLYFCDPFVDLF